MTDAIMYIFVTLLLILAAISATIQGGLLGLNHFQLKRQAQSGDKKAKLVYPLHALRFELYIVTGLVSLLVNAFIILLFTDNLGSVFGVIFGVVALLFFEMLFPLLFLRSRALSIIAFAAPLLRKVVAFTAPLTRPVAARVEQLLQGEDNALYTKEQLLSMFENTKKQADSDVTSDELLMLRGALEFGEKKIRDIMTPRRMVRVVLQDDEVGPLLMDELHRSGHSRFPVVVDMKSMEFVGTLYLRDLIGQKSLKKVKDIMSSDVRYVHEEESLDHALRAFLKTHHHLFVVVNNFEEFVGVLSIEDVLEEVIGKEIIDEFDQHHDLRAVAASIAEKEKKKRLAREIPTKQPAKVVK